MSRTYGDAIAALNTLQSNSSIVTAIKRAGLGRNKNAIPEMIEWVHRIGYEPSDFDKLKPIHIAGTKGKGSTSAFVSSILAQYLPSPSQPKPLFQKIGLYTSPHLRFVRERIQINNQPLSEEVFAEYFFQTWDRLENSARAKGEPTGTTAKPVYFRFLTLMAFHTYMSEGVDTAIIECGIGGEYDSTNILISPTVTGITSLGIDHTSLLGNTIEEIAWHKAGIMKPSAPCFTAPQPPPALSVLQTRAAETPTPLHLVPLNPTLQSIKLGLAAPFQQINASLAIAIATSRLSTLSQTPTSPLPPEFITGLTQVHWPGRCEIRHTDNITWHIDSGHTLESIQAAATWFASSLLASPHPPKPRILLFNQQTRDANALVRALHATLVAALGEQKPFTHAVFCSNVTSRTGGYRPDLVSVNVERGVVERLEVQEGLRETWEGIEKGTRVVVRGTIEEAVGWCRDVAGEGVGEGEVAVLVTGSVHLVGGFLEVLETGEGEGV